MQTNVDAHLVVERVSRVCTPRVCAGWAFETAEIVGVAEIVVAVRIRAERGIVALGRQRERCATRPASNHLRREHCLLFAVRGFGSEVLPVRRNPRVQLSEHEVGAVPTEHFGGRHRREASRLVWIAENELPCLDRSSLPAQSLRCRSPLPSVGRSRP